MKTFIRFVIFKGEVLAVFMRKDAGMRFNGRQWLRGCYAHIGQHGDCYDGMQRRKKATRDQYKELKREMESMGYQLTII